MLDWVTVEDTTTATRVLALAAPGEGYQWSIEKFVKSQSAEDEYSQLFNHVSAGTALTPRLYGFALSGDIGIRCGDNNPVYLFVSADGYGAMMLGYRRILA